MGKIYNYDTHGFIGGTVPVVASAHGTKGKFNSSEFRPHEKSTPTGMKAKGKSKGSKKKGC